MICEKRCEKMSRNKTLLWERESVTMTEFLKLYRNKLPVVVRIDEINRQAGHWRNVQVVSIKTCKLEKTNSSTII